MKLQHINSFQKFGIFGLINHTIDNYGKDANPRVLAYNLLKDGRQIAKKFADNRLKLLPEIALDMSGHESIYRATAFLYLELKEYKEALKALSYLHYYYSEHEAEPHKQYQLIHNELLDNFITESELYRFFEEDVDSCKQRILLNNIKDFAETLPENDISEQAEYFSKIYRRFGLDSVIASILTDVRFNNRQKAVLLIRASRAVASIAKEGPSIESIFANKALELDTSDTVVKNSLQAYLRAGDLNKISQLKENYSKLLS